MRIQTPKENRNWRDILGRVCRWALPRTDSQARRDNLQRTLAQLHLIDQVTCQIVATEWLDELASDQQLH